MKRLLLKILYLQLFWLLCFSGFSQVNKTGIPFFKNFSPKEYKAHSTNWAIAHDNRGVIYIGNMNNGVLEYDGKSWKQISIPNNPIVRSLAVDSNGTVYVGALGEFGYIEPDATGKLHYKSISSGLDTSKYKFSNVWKTYVNNNNQIYFCALNYIFIYSSKNKIEPVKLPEESFFSFYENGKLYINSFKNGLFVLNGNKVDKATGGNFFANQDIFKILPYKKSQLLIFSNNGLFVYNTDDGTIEKQHKNIQFNKLSQFLKENSAYNGTCIDDNLYAWATISAGVVIAEKKGKIIENYKDSTGLQDNMVSDVYYMKDQGVIWSTLNNGISKFEYNSPLKYFGSESKIDGTVSDINRYLGKLYVGTSLGLYTLEYADGKLATFKLIPTFRGIAVTSLRVVKVNEKEHLIVGTFSGIYDIIDDQVIDLHTKEIYAYNVYVSKYIKNTFYIGCEKGLYTATFINGNWKISPNEKINKEIVCSMAEDNDGDLWMGTSVNGVFRLSHEGTVTKFSKNDGLPVMNDIVVSNTVSGLVFATPKGFYLYNKTKNKFQPFEPFRNNITKNKKNIINVFPGFNNQTWLNVDNKVYKLIKHYSDFRIDTVPFRRLPQMTLQAIFSEPNGITWIGGSEGLFCFDNFYKRKYNVPYNALIRMVTTNSDSVLFYGTNYKLINNIRVPSLIQPDELKPQLSYRLNNLTFNFAAPYFEDEQDIQYSYLLEGFSENWSDWTYENKKEFTNLSEGTYVFKVKAKNIYGGESAEALYEFEILPPWYRTVWAYIGYGIFGILILIFSVKIYTRKLEADKKRLEGIVVERTAEIVKQKDEILEKNKEIEHKNKDITDSIRYAQRIQEALLPTAQTFEVPSVEFFIYFKPKDIVSGDFYFLRRVDRAHMLVAAAADCTGHGVPGAFMSMLGMSFLNEIIVKPDVMHSDIVLNHLRESIIESLNQSGREGETKDGMDISLIAYDYENHKLEFSGANNPLYLVRDGELQEFKGDKMPIGLHDKADVPFARQNIDIKVGDIVYLFSDGFADQFGGEKGRKYMYKKFKERLVEIHQNTLEEQRNILEKEILDWRGELEQIDDHIVMGIKFVS